MNFPLIANIIVFIVLLFVLAPGGFIAYGLLLGVINAISEKIAARKEKEGGGKA